jgi:hypothetical protein
MKSKKQPTLACPIDAIGASARPMVVFSGFYESPGPPPLGDACGIVLPHCNDPSKWVHNKSLFCGFRCSPGHAALGDAACITSTPHHGHQNGLQWRGNCLPPQSISLGIIVAKDHVMVH